MLRDEVAIGAIAVMRLEPQLFPRAQVELLKTFAGQAVIAIENTRLFTELQERSGNCRSRWKICAPRKTAWSDREAGRAGTAGGRRRDESTHRSAQPDGGLGVDRQDQVRSRCRQGRRAPVDPGRIIAASREAAPQIMVNLNHVVDLIQSFKQVAADRNSDRDALISAR